MRWPLNKDLCAMNIFNMFFTIGLTCNHVKANTVHVGVFNFVGPLNRGKDNKNFHRGFKLQY